MFISFKSIQKLYVLAVSIKSIASSSFFSNKIANTFSSLYASNQFFIA